MNKDLILRILITFVEAALAYIGVQLAHGVDFNDKEVIKALIVGAIGAGLSAVFNIAKTAVKARDVNEDLPEDEELTEDDI
jgi:uncharacterized membrane protein